MFCLLVTIPVIIIICLTSSVIHLLCSTVIPLKLTTKTFYIHLHRKPYIYVTILNFFEKMPKFIGYSIHIYSLIS